MYGYPKNNVRRPAGGRWRPVLLLLAASLAIEDGCMTVPEAPGLGVEDLDLALEVLTGRCLDRPLDGVELGSRLLRDAIRVLRAGALDCLYARAELGEVGAEAVDVLAKGSGRIGRPLGLVLGLRALAERAATGQTGHQHRRDHDDGTPPAPRPASGMVAARGPSPRAGRPHAHSPHRSTHAVSGSTNRRPDAVAT